MKDVELINGTLYVSENFIYEAERIISSIEEELLFEVKDLAVSKETEEEITSIFYAKILDSLRSKV